MNAVSTQASFDVEAVQELTPAEIEAVSGGYSWYYTREDGSSFNWIGPNGQRFSDVTIVTSHWFQYADGSQEWFSDIFAKNEYPVSIVSERYFW